MFKTTNERKVKSGKRGLFPAVSLALMVSMLTFAPSVTAAGTAPNLATATGYGTLAATSTVTNQTHIAGNLGTGSITGTADVKGTTDVANSAYTNAFTDYGVALNYVNSQPADYTNAPTDLGGKTVIPGVYDFTGAVNIGSNVVLNGNGIYIFRVAGELKTAANTTVVLQGGAQACNVFWVADVATVGANSKFVGTLMSESAITLGDNSTVNGRAFATTALTANAANTNITVPTACGAISPTTGEKPTSGITPTDGGTSTDGTGKALPNTATPFYNMLFGAIAGLVATGAIMFGMNRKKSVKA
jgi:hypothetical protein